MTSVGPAHSRSGINRQDWGADALSNRSLGTRECQIGFADYCLCEERETLREKLTFGNEH
jgi:hypothetical protein